MLSNNNLKNTPAFIEVMEVDYVLDLLIETTDTLGTIVERLNNNNECLDKNKYNLHTAFMLIETIEKGLLEFEFLEKNDADSTPIGL